MTVNEAIEWLDDQHCPIDGDRTLVEVEYDELAHYAQVCPKGHRWPYAKGHDDRCCNAFEGEFDPDVIEEKLEEYCNAAV